VRVGAAIFDVEDAASGLIGKTEFAFEMGDEGTKGVGVVPTDGRINMNMVDRPGGATGSGTRDQAAKLPAEVGGGKAARLDKPDLLSVLA